MSYDMTHGAMTRPPLYRLSVHVVHEVMVRHAINAIWSDVIGRPGSDTTTS